MSNNYSLLFHWYFFSIELIIRGRIFSNIWTCFKWFWTQMIIFAKFSAFTWEISSTGTCTGTLKIMVSHRSELKPMSNMNIRLILWDFVFKITSQIFTWTKCAKCMICTFWRHVCNKIMNEIDELNINKKDFQQHEMWWWTCSICTLPVKIYRVKITKNIYCIDPAISLPPPTHKAITVKCFPWSCEDN